MAHQFESPRVIIEALNAKKVEYAKR